MAGIKDCGGLVLSRAEGDVICVGDDVIVQVVRIRSGQVRLRVIAPRDVLVVRGELQATWKNRQVKQ